MNLWKCIKCKVEYLDPEKEIPADKICEICRTKKNG